MGSWAERTLCKVVVEDRAAPRPHPETSCAADVLLDPDTAHPELFLSQDQRRVGWGPSRQILPNNPKTLDCRPCVLGVQGFSSGRHYWEVEVGNVMVWAVGVCADRVQRKGEALLGPQNGFCTLGLLGHQCRVLSSPEKTLPLKERLHQVAVFLDYECGDVSFYNMRDQSHIYTCPRSRFSGPLRPFFRLGSDDSHLFLCPAFTGAQGVTVPEGSLVLHGAGTHRSHQTQRPGLRAQKRSPGSPCSHSTAPRGLGPSLWAHQRTCPTGQGLPPVPAHPPLSLLL
ncbi:butyrophilin subfamily 2 member A2-like [Phyllostomus discolor]|uniref:Butyrophilin subfamily 2 member A2-like n=1 Tax=Phyllostomus discolor TaxID=89673 RepID=A0A7E6CX83_9CHIR|nr:butyrophilin subfamily 2 member A2-like [Phyllostomus discolor]